jgi:hypothetical protein
VEPHFCEDFCYPGTRGYEVVKCAPNQAAVDRYGVSRADRGEFQTSR